MTSVCMAGKYCSTMDSQEARSLPGLPQYWGPWSSCTNLRERCVNHAQTCCLKFELQETSLDGLFDKNKHQARLDLWHPFRLIRAIFADWFLTCARTYYIGSSFMIDFRETHPRNHQLSCLAKFEAKCLKLQKKKPKT